MKIIKIMQIINFLWESRNYENLRNPCENHENHENIKII